MSSLVPVGLLTLDLASGYNQVPVAEQDKPKTALCTPFGLFEWNRMPFGLCHAPSTFQRLMQRMFGDQHCQSLLLYLDDCRGFVGGEGAGPKCRHGKEPGVT